MYSVIRFLACSCVSGIFTQKLENEPEMVHFGHLFFDTENSLCDLACLVYVCCPLIRPRSLLRQTMSVRVYSMSSAISASITTSGFPTSRTSYRFSVIINYILRKKNLSDRYEWEKTINFSYYLNYR